MDKRKSRSSNREQVIDLVAYRKNKSEERRREYERVLFNRILGVYTFIEKPDVSHIEIVDISLSGVRFKQFPKKGKIGAFPLMVGDKVPLRFYFTPHTFLRVIAEIKRANPVDEEGRQGMEYGCLIDQNTKSYEVIQRLIQFMESFAEVGTDDQNPPLVFF